MQFFISDSKFLDDNLESLHNSITNCKNKTGGFVWKRNSKYEITGS